jgi:cyclophilin family peptidyl-prolyl cis-trans isomerase
MRPRIVKIGIAVLVSLGIAAGVIFSNHNAKSPDPSTPPAAAVNPAATEAAPATPATEVPSAVVDLAVDASGLSKTTVVIEAPQGKIKYKFYSKDAEKTVLRMVELIQKGFYNGLKFHRVVPGFVIQGGDPVGDGTGGSGQKLKAEFNGRRHIEGTVAMARSQDPDSADSQFYISLGTHPHLDRSYTVFGQVIEGMDIAKKIQMGDAMTKVYLE